jgi:hypothetical protein
MFNMKVTSIQPRICPIQCESQYVELNDIIARAQLLRQEKTLPLQASFFYRFDVLRRLAH